MNEDQIEKITRLLEIGGTMLAEHCDQCGAPRFRYKGIVLCPVCDFEKFSRQAVIKQEKQEKFIKEPSVKGTEQQRPVRVEELNNLERAVKNKLLKLAVDLDKETELLRIKQQFECIEKGIIVLKLIRDYHEILGSI